MGKHSATGTMSTPHLMQPSQFGKHAKPYQGKHAGGVNPFKNPLQPTQQGKHAAPGRHAKPASIPQATYGQQTKPSASPKPTAQGQYTAKHATTGTLPAASHKVPQGKVVPHGTHAGKSKVPVNKAKIAKKKPSKFHIRPSKHAGKNAEHIKALVH